MAVLAGCGGGGSGPQPGPDRFILSGTVTGSGGTPLSGVQLLLGLSPTITGADGTYSYGNLLPGSYTVSAQDSSGNFHASDLTLGQANLTHNITLPTTSTGLSASSVSPALNSTAAGLNGPISIGFTAEINSATVDVGDFSITPEPGELAVEVDGNSIELTPLDQLPIDQLYVVEITGQVSAVGGDALSSPVRWRFRTRQTDNVAPVLRSTNPANGVTNYPPNLGLVFEFNEPVAQPDTELMVSVTPAASVNLSAGGSALFVQPESQWAKNTEYTVELSNIADLAGNRDAAETISLTFTTGSTLAPSSNIEPEWNRVRDRIVFASNRFGNYDIYSIAPDGTNLSRLTNLPGDERHPTVSADGSLLAFQHRISGGNWNIYVLNLDSAGDARQITTDQFNDIEPVFSRTFSNEIFFVSERSDPVGIYLMNPDGSNPTELDAGFGSVQSQPAPHPLLDTQLLFSSYRSGSRDIWRKSISAIDANVVNLNLTDDVLAEEHSPTWAPDASYIVYISNENGTDNLWLADSGGEFPRQVTGFDQAVASPSVAPVQGEELCVVSVRIAGGGSDLLIVDLVSGDETINLTGTEAAD